MKVFFVENHSFNKSLSSETCPWYSMALQNILKVFQGKKVFNFLISCETLRHNYLINGTNRPEYFTNRSEKLLIPFSSKFD